MFSVTEIKCGEGVDENELLSLTLASEKYSTHPIAAAIRRFGEENTYAPSPEVSEIEEISGLGVKAQYQGEILLVGNDRLMRESNIDVETVSPGVGVYVALGNRYLGSLALSDKPKDNAKTAISALFEQGIIKTVMLSGDKENEARRICEALSLNSYRAELLPSDKVSALEEIMKSSEKLCAYVGDGINDAPVLARADVGIAMGALGSDAAIEAADIVLMNDNLEKIGDAVALSKRTRSIVIQNIAFALSVKALALILGALGIVGLGIAIFADVGVAVIAILNSMRNLK